MLESYGTPVDGQECTGVGDLQDDRSSMIDSYPVARPSKTDIPSQKVGGEAALTAFPDRKIKNITALDNNTPFLLIMTITTYRI